MSFIHFSYQSETKNTLNVFFKEKFLGKITKTELGWQVDKSGVFYRNKRVASLRLIVLDIKKSEIGVKNA